MVTRLTNRRQDDSEPYDTKVNVLRPRNIKVTEEVVFNTGEEINALLTYSSEAMKVVGSNLIDVSRLGTMCSFRPLPIGYSNKGAQLVFKTYDLVKIENLEVSLVIIPFQPFAGSIFGFVDHNDIYKEVIPVKGADFIATMAPSIPKLRIVHGEGLSTIVLKLFSKIPGRYEKTGQELTTRSDPFTVLMGFTAGLQAQMTLRISYSFTVKGSRVNENTIKTAIDSMLPSAQYNMAKKYDRDQAIAMIRQADLQRQLDSIKQELEKSFKATEPLMRLVHHPMVSPAMN